MTSKSQLPAPATQSTSQSSFLESGGCKKNLLALLDAGKGIATGIENINETLKQLLDVLANK